MEPRTQAEATTVYNTIMNRKNIPNMPLKNTTRKQLKNKSVTNIKNIELTVFKKTF